MKAEPGLAGKRILLIVGGGIAAYKALDVARHLVRAGAEVRAVMTQAAQQFVTPLSFASLTGRRVYTDLFSLTDEAEMGHIQLSREADLVVVAPATANLMARMAHGLADDLASTLLLATDTRVLIAPAMNVRMWLHCATIRNLERLRQDGVLVVGPDEGAMACGEHGPGRLAEPAVIVATIADALKQDTKLPLSAPAMSPKPLAGRRAVVTSGPTHEPIDPVRYLANRSSGRQGHAIAEALAEAGADVVLVSGPVALPDPIGLRTAHVETARQMLAAVEAALPADIMVAAAAVADWRVDGDRPQKIKKSEAKTEPPALRLVENPDILATVARRVAGRPPVIVGFAAETEHLIDHAAGKLARKGCDLIVANDVGQAGGVMGGDHNTVHLLSRDGIETWPRMSKAAVARRLVERIATLLGGSGP